MEVYLYVNKAHYKYVDKRSNLTLINTITCHLQEGCSVQNPVFKFDKSSVGDISQANYMYVPDFGRYYFITDIDCEAGGICIITARVDVLTSNANAIRGLRCQVQRQENNYNMDLPDNDIPVLAKRFLTYKNFSATPFSTNPQGRHFVLTVSGSSAVSND